MGAELRAEFEKMLDEIRTKNDALRTVQSYLRMDELSQASREFLLALVKNAIKA